jgi:methyl-accepting chemotaxis protein
VASLTNPPNSTHPTVPLDEGLDELAESRANTRAVIQVITAVGESTDSDSMLLSTLEAVKAGFGYDYGACWMIDQRLQQTTFAMEAGNLGPAFDRVNQDTNYKKGQGLTGKTWATADVVFIPVLNKIPNSSLVDAACSAGVAAAVAFPFIVHGEVHGVFFFFSFHPMSPSQDRLETLRNIGRLVGQAFSRLLELERETVGRVQLQQSAEEILVVVQAAHRGNLTVDMPPGGQDAIGQVAQALGSFLSGLRQSIQKILRSTHALHSAAEALNQLSLRMREHSEDTANTAACVTEESKVVSSNLGHVVAGCEQMLASICAIVKSASHAAADVHTAVQSAAATRQQIGRLVASASDIGGEIKVIEAIARQTRLLALNASIEAARAGSAGLGFTVVANEVKQLALGTANATGQITDKIEAIQQNTNSAVESIGNIAVVMERVNGLSNSIKHTVEEQATTTREIGTNVTQAAAGSASISHKIAGVADLAKIAQREAAETQSAARTLNGLAAELNSLIANFQV